MWRYSLIGHYSKRTPLAYTPYINTMGEKGLNLARQVSLNQNPDVLFFGYTKDFKNQLKAIKDAKAKNPQVKIIVLSEEPLWDTVWSQDFFKKNNSAQIFDEEIDYFSFNHANSKIYNFEKIPYFITTNDNFSATYRFLFKRNANLEKLDVIKLWDKHKYKLAFFFEKRLDPKYSVYFEDFQIHGLCNYRTELASNLPNDSKLLVGKGWQKGTVRQDLPDWHLDKITALDQKTLFLSALENTHQANYITEKMFDAYAINAIPLYIASPNHRANEVFGKEAFINLYKLSIEEAQDKIMNFSYSEEFIDSYLSAQINLAQLFSQECTIRYERERLCTTLNSEILEIL